jgi:peptide/nickel transport system substrate-binding protein
MRSAIRYGFCLVAGLAMAGPAAAQSITMGFDSEWTAVDPHFHSFPQNLSVAHHVFDALVEADASSRLHPKLALSWRALDDRTWEFKLRTGVKFHDGSDFTAQDVAASIARVPKVPNSPGSLTPQVRAIASSEIKDPHTIVFKLSQPEPILPTLLTDIYIIPAKLAGATTEEFNNGKAMIGTGAYKFVRWARGDRASLERNDAYWAGKPAWSKVDIRVLTNTASREAALLSGEVDFIQNPSTTSLKRLEGNPKLVMHKAASTRITYLQVHQGPEPKADIKAADGKNPFVDARVRKALSLAIQRQVIAERVMDGLSLPASQLVPPGQPGYSAAVAVDPYDLNRAKQLLAEAGYPNGFEITLSTPNDRNVNGVKIAETIAATFARIGVKTNVNAVPLNVYISEWRKQAYGFVMHGAGPPPATILLLPQLAGTKDKGPLGRSNEAHYSNAKLDDLLLRLGAELDPAKAEALIAEAVAIINAETAILPLHHEIVVWASRKGLGFQARADARTWATALTPAGN